MLGVNAGLEFQPPVIQRQHDVGRYDIDVVPLRNETIRDLFDGQRCRLLQQPGQHALMLRRQVLDEQECHSRARGQLGEQFAERLEPTGRRADTHDRGACARLDLSRSGPGHVLVRFIRHTGISSRFRSPRAVRVPAAPRR